MSSSPTNEWATPEHALAYLERADTFPHRAEGEAVVLELLPPRLTRVLDLGCGDGRLLSIVRGVHPQLEGVALDFSAPMLEASRRRFADAARVSIVEHDMETPLPALGTFQAIVSSFAIHHLEHDRKRSLYREVFEMLEPGGIFINLEHVSSPTAKLTHDFYVALGTDPEVEQDPSNRCAPVEDQLTWMREAGFEDVDCFWKWRETAVLAGSVPA